MKCFCIQTEAESHQALRGRVCVCKKKPRVCNVMTGCIFECVWLRNSLQFASPGLLAGISVHVGRKNKYFFPSASCSLLSSGQQHRPPSNARAARENIRDLSVYSMSLLYPSIVYKSPVTKWHSPVVRIQRWPVCTEDDAYAFGYHMASARSW